MRKYTYIQIALLGLCFFAFNSCDKDKDTEGPIITINDPKKGESFTRGEYVHIDFNLEDKSGINNYKIDIHWGDHGEHEHKHSVSTKNVEDIEWAFLKVYDDKKGEKKAHVHIHADIPATARLGEYHFGVQATDLEGNDSQKYVSINIVK